MEDNQIDLFSLNEIKETENISIKKQDKNKITYHGNVVVNIIGDKRTRTSYYHNEASPLMLKVLASCLCGNNESNNVPMFLDAGYTDDLANLDTANYTSLLYQVVFLQSRYVTENVANFNGLITYSNINHGLIRDSVEVNTLYLYGKSKDQNTWLARIFVNPDDFNFTQRYNALVNWRIELTADTDGSEE